MTKHMFRCAIGIGAMSTSDLETRLNDWVNSNGEWLEDTVEHTLKEKNTEIDGTGQRYYTIDARFHQNKTKENILQKFEDKLINKVNWYRISYHVCTHDDSHSAVCNWDDTVEWTAKDVTIPAGVPQMQ